MAMSESAGKPQNLRLGILLMVLTMLTFATQDGFSKFLAERYNVLFIVMIRYWFFALFALAVVARSRSGIRGAIRTRHLGLQILRGVLLALEVCVLVYAFVVLGLIESHAVFTCYPLIIAALSGPILREQVGIWRWTAIAIGFVGVLIILRPGAGVFSVYALIPLASATMFAVYSLLTRYVARDDSSDVSLFWTGIGGAVTMTLIGLWFAEPIAMQDWGWLAGLCVLAAIGHWVLILAYDVAEAGALQPFSYLQLVFVSAIGFFIFHETLEWQVAFGGALVVAAGIFTILRTRMAR